MLAYCRPTYAQEKGANRRQMGVASYEKWSSRTKKGPAVKLAQVEK
jgi:hypothetical protein